MNMDLRSSQIKVWESMRNDARRCEAEVEEYLVQLESLGGDETNFLRYDRVYSDASQTLKKFTVLVKSMSSKVAEMREAGAGVNEQHVFQMTARFEEVVGDKTRTLARIHSETKRKRERAELLVKVKSDITAFNDSSNMRTMATENEHLRQTKRMTEQILMESDETQERLQRQRGMFGAIEGRLKSIGDRYPVINDILKRIDKKKRRDMIILGVMIAFCLFLTWYFW